MPRYPVACSVLSRSRLYCALFFSLIPLVNGLWSYPDNGWATMTHYDLPKDYIASCGCTGKSTHYPTAALSHLAYGSTAAYGPSCGRCFNLTLLNTIYSDPLWYPDPTKSIVVKVTDLCPGPGLCGATEGNPNSVGAYLNFDLAYPSTAIHDGWYPANVSYYGYDDFGVWNISYQSISCSHWDGWKDKGALGSVPNQYPGVCCPSEPNATFTCPSYSEQYGDWPPDTTTSGTISRLGALHTTLLSFSLLFTIACTFTS